MIFLMWPPSETKYSLQEAKSISIRAWVDKISWNSGLNQRL